MRRNLAGILFILVLLLGYARPSRGEYYVGHLEEIPIDRLMDNLDRRLRQEPDNARANYLLARVHSMAYAVRQPRFRVEADSGNPSFDDGASGVFLPPPSVEPPADEADRERRQAHLDSAIELFDRSLKLAPDDLYSRVGLGWCLMKAERNEEALATFRPAFETAWESENDADGGEWGRSLTVELGSYLLALLDPHGDADEINLIKRRVKVIEGKPRWITPILIPLGDQLDFDNLVTSKPSVEFNLDGSGVRRWQWITPQAGWLVHDPGGRGEITSGRDLIGGIAFWVMWSDGYEALAALDDNGDGALRGTELRDLALWQDADGNGLSEPGEVRSLADWEIVELRCFGSRISPTLMMHPEGASFANGATRPTYDWSPKGLPLGVSRHGGKSPPS